jgi:hypothetical protein
MRQRFLGPLVLLLGAAACERQDPEPAAAPGERQNLVTLAYSLKAHLDSGNAAYSDQKYDVARDHYRRAVALDSTLSAAWFGIYMAETKLGNKAAADSAIVRARKEGDS